MIGRAVVGAVVAFGVALGVWHGDWSGRVVPPPVSPPVTPETVPVSSAIFLASAVPFIGAWEGLRLEAYKDIVGVWTVCYGETRGVKAGDRYTRAECDRMFGKALLVYRRGMHSGVKGDAIKYLVLRRDIAFTSLAYNVGVSAVKKSTAMRRLNAGKIAGSCEALTWWNKAGKRVVRGLVRRRSAEYKLCMEGLS